MSVKNTQTSADTALTSRSLSYCKGNQFIFTSILVDYLDRLELYRETFFMSAINSTKTVFKAALRSSVPKLLS